MGYGCLSIFTLFPTLELSGSGSRGLSRKTRNSQAKLPPPRDSYSINERQEQCQSRTPGAGSVFL